MKRAHLLAALVLALAPSCGERTQLMFGVATDLRAPDAIDKVRLDIVRADNGQPELGVDWDISGAANVPFNLPGSYGVFSDGEEFKLAVQLTGLKGDQLVVQRNSIIGLVEGETLFYRLGLTAGCIGRTDCPEGFSCVEGVCRDEVINSDQLPDFTESLVTELTCTPGVNYLDTGTGDPMPLSATASECPAGLCLEGTCLKPPPAESGTRTVRGSKIKTFILPTVQETVPEDLSAVDIAALVTDEDGIVTELPGVGNADGTFAIQNVPHGSYVLKVGTNYSVTAADNIDLGFPVLGRPDVKTVTDTANTGVTLNLTGMAPWEETGGLLSAYSPTANQWWFFFDDSLETPPTEGQTTLSGTVLNYDNFGTAELHLVENDPFAVLQYTNKTAGDPDATKYQVATKVLTTTSLKMVEGQLATVSGAFNNVPQTETISLDVRQLEWESTVGWNGTNPTLLNPTAFAVDFSIAGVTGNTGGVNLDIFGQPGGNQFGQFSATIDYLFLTAPEGKNAVFNNLTFGTPDIGGYTYGKQLFAGITYAVPYQFGTAQPTNQLMTINTLRSADTDLLIVNPLLGPVRDATINDRDIFIPQQNVPPTSRIAWKAPALGTASLYSVRFFQLGVDGENRTTRTVVANVDTTDTFLDVPPGILIPGQTYFFLVSATNAGNIDAPARGRLPDAFTPVASAQFTVGIGTGTDPIPPPDAGTEPPDAFITVDTPTGSICDPIAQDCGAGQKCTFDGNEFRFLCDSDGTIANNASICTGTGNGDNCVAGTICIEGTCRSYCPQNGNTVGCQVNETCQTAGPFNICLTNCNALAQNCPATGAGPQNCYENQAGGECLKSTGNLAIGQSCFELHDCVGGSGCHGGTCRKYCNHDTFPEMQGPCSAGQVCTALEANNPVGICQ